MKIIQALLIHLCTSGKFKALTNSQLVQPYHMEAVAPENYLLDLSKY